MQSYLKDVLSIAILYASNYVPTHCFSYSFTISEYLKMNFILVSLPRLDFETDIAHDVRFISLYV